MRGLQTKHFNKTGVQLHTQIQPRNIRMPYLHFWTAIKRRITSTYQQSLRNQSWDPRSWKTRLAPYNPAVICELQQSTFHLNHSDSYHLSLSSLQNVQRENKFFHQSKNSRANSIKSPVILSRKSHSQIPRIKLGHGANIRESLSDALKFYHAFRTTRKPYAIDLLAFISRKNHYSRDQAGQSAETSKGPQCIRE